MILMSKWRKLYTISSFPNWKVITWVSFTRQSGELLSILHLAEKRRPTDDTLAAWYFKTLPFLFRERILIKSQAFNGERWFFLQQTSLHSTIHPVMQMKIPFSFLFKGEMCSHSNLHLLFRPSVRVSFIQSPPSSFHSSIREGKDI